MVETALQVMTRINSENNDYMIYQLMIPRFIGKINHRNPLDNLIPSSFLGPQVPKSLRSVIGGSEDNMFWANFIAWRINNPSFDIMPTHPEVIPSSILVPIYLFNRIIFRYVLGASEDNAFTSWLTANLNANKKILQLHPELLFPFTKPLLKVVKIVNETFNIVESVSTMIKSFLTSIINTSNDNAFTSWFIANINSKEKPMVTTHPDLIPPLFLKTQYLVTIINETFNIVEGIIATSKLVRMVNETVNIVESVLNVRKLVRLVNETVSIVESIIPHRNIVKIVNEIFNIIESKIKVGGLEGHRVRMALLTRRVIRASLAIQKPFERLEQTLKTMRKSLQT